jgi:hypothetical protein
VKVVARGALSLQTKEAAQMRINEFLAATGNPVDMQIVGLEGRAELLRSAAKLLNVNPDKVVPPEPVLHMRQAMQAQQMQQMPQPQSGGTPAKPGQSREQLMDGTPTTDNFSPRKVQ